MPMIKRLQSSLICEHIDRVTRDYLKKLYHKQSHKSWWWNALAHILVARYITVPITACCERRLKGALSPSNCAAGDKVRSFLRPSNLSGRHDIVGARERDHCVFIVCAAAPRPFPQFDGVDLPDAALSANRTIVGLSATLPSLPYTYLLPHTPSKPFPGSLLSWRVKNSFLITVGFIF